MDEKITTHSFLIEDAFKYGIEPAVMLYNIRFWVSFNVANKRNFKDGHCWTFNSAEAFTKIFPYWSMKKIQRILIDLEEQGAIKSGNYNKKPYDKTKWYTLGQNCPIEVPKMSNPLDKTVQPIPDINIYINSDVKDNVPEYLLSFYQDKNKEELTHLAKVYHATEREVAKKAEQLYNWCQASGKKYKMYRPFLKNALEKDYGKRSDINKNNPATL